MKTLRVISGFAAIIIIVAIIINVPDTSGTNQKSIILQSKTERSTIIATYDSLESIVKRMQVANTAMIPHTLHTIANPQSTQNNSNTEEVKRSLNRLHTQITLNKRQSLQSNSNNTPKAEYKKDLSVEKFWIEVIISGIIGIAALFVILTKKYNEETQKWAFSALTLIAGTWIGTVM